MNLVEFLKTQNIPFKSKNEGLSVGGSLYLRGTGITSLPEDLSVGGILDLRGTGITSLPEGLSVGGSLYLRGTGITSLPEDLSVGGSLDLRGTGITSLPEDLSVGGSLDLRDTGITSLPEDLSVGGKLYFSCPWGFQLLNNEIKIGCALKKISDWKIFFDTNSFYQTNPKTDPETYRNIKNDFYNFLKLNGL
jgi:hypothetical protein